MAAMTSERIQRFAVDDPAYGEKARARGQEFVAGLDALLPGIASRRDETDALGKAHPRSVAEMIEAGVFRALTPLQWGGLEIDPASWYEGMAKLASACASTGWVGSLVGVHAWQLALFDPLLQSEIWRDSPDVLVSSSYPPPGNVKPVDGGFLLSGQWAFSSGVDHASWAILGGRFVNPDGVMEFRSFVVPRADLEIDDASWNVVGLRGTGSKTLELRDAYVPEHRTHSALDVHRRSERGFALNDRPLYRLPWISIFWSTISCVAVGAAQGALSAFIDENRARVAASTLAPAAANPFMQLRLANALGDVHAVRDRMLSGWRDLYQTVCAGSEPCRQDRLRSRFESADTIARCYEAVSQVIQVGGGGVISATKPVQRFFRDLIAIRNHPTANREVFATLYAQSVLGLPPPAFDPSTMTGLILLD
jgi:3-hydroxy-9,10-secoandrosta-1,3,5(10)-triene-9,17-dione monooxygenase